MKKLLILLAIFVTFNASAQNTTTLPSPTTSFTPSFRYYGTLLDSLRQTWMQTPGGGWNRIYTATEARLLFAPITGGGYVPNSRTLTIAGTAYDLSANRTWTLANLTNGFGISSFIYNGSGAIVLKADTTHGSSGLLTYSNFPTLGNTYYYGKTASDAKYAQLIGGNSFSGGDQVINVSGRGLRIGGNASLGGGMIWDSSVGTPSDSNFALSTYPGSTTLNSTGVTYLTINGVNGAQVTNNGFSQLGYLEATNYPSGTAGTDRILVQKSTGGAFGSPIGSIPGSSYLTPANTRVTDSLTVGVYPTKTETLLTYGNSITLGIAANPTTTKGYAPIVARQANLTLDNRGVSSSVISTMMITGFAAIPAYTSTIKYITLMWGTNEARGSLPIATYRAQLGAVIDSLNTIKGYPLSKIKIIGTPYGTYASIYPIVSYSVADSLTAVSKGVQFIEMYRFMLRQGGATLLDPDGIHPTNKGHEIIAAQVLQSINPPALGNILALNNITANNSVTASLFNGTTATFKTSYTNNAASDTSRVNYLNATNAVIRLSNTTKATSDTTNTTYLNATNSNLGTILSTLDFGGAAFTTRNALLSLNGGSTTTRTGIGNNSIDLAVFGRSVGKILFGVGYDASTLTSANAAMVIDANVAVKTAFSVTGTTTLAIGSATTFTASTLLQGATIRSTSLVAPASGSGTELLYSGGTGYLFAYDRTGGAYLNLKIGNANQLNLPSTGKIWVNGSGSNGSGAQLEVNGNINSSTLTPSQLVATDANKILVSVTALPSGTTQAMVNATSTQTTVSGTSSGSIICSMPFQGSSYKKVIIYLNNLTSTSITYTYPVAFTQTPKMDIYYTGTMSPTSNSTQISITGTGAGGWITLEGY